MTPLRHLGIEAVATHRRLDQRLELFPNLARLALVQGVRGEVERAAPYCAREVLRAPARAIRNYVEDPLKCFWKCGAGAAMPAVTSARRDEVVERAARLARRAPSPRSTFPSIREQYRGLTLANRHSLERCALGAGVWPVLGRSL